LRALQRFHRGEISSMRNLDEAVASWEASKLSTPPTPSTPQPQGQVIQFKAYVPRDPRTVPPRDFLYAYDYIRSYTSCTIARLASMLAHHSRKTNGNDVTAEDARGASALLAAVRSGRVINTMTKQEAEQLGVRNRRTFFRVENGKANLALPPEEADWFELRGQPLGNGGLGIA
jgi:hypothetical protein